MTARAWWPAPSAWPACRPVQRVLPEAEPEAGVRQLRLRHPHHRIRINRNGWLSTLRTEIGDHQLEAGLWLEHNRSSAYRRWYALDVNNPARRTTAPAIR
jgi:hypothetical protein